MEFQALESHLSSAGVVRGVRRGERGRDNHLNPKQNEFFTNGEGEKAFWLSHVTQHSKQVFFYILE